MKKTLADIDRNSIWHPFTQMADYRTEEPVIIERGEGCRLIDTKGKRYLDGVSSLWVNVHGHRHPKLDRALKDQVDKIAHSTLLGLSNVPSIEFAEKLLSVAPQNLKHVFYSDSGSTAVEIALKIAFQYFQQVNQPGKTQFVSFENAYHGDTIGAVGVGGIDLFHSLYRPLLFDAFRAPHPYGYRCEEIHQNEDPYNDCCAVKSPSIPLFQRGTLKKGMSQLACPPLKKGGQGGFSQGADCLRHCLDQLKEILAKHHEQIAACILEPLVQGAAGIITAPKGFLKGVRELCSQYNVLLILDEVATGFGRTGTMFACEQEEVEPDILCLAKGITGGYLPLAATLTTEEIYQGFLGDYEELKTFFHGHTYTGNPLACALAKANLELFEEEKTLSRVQARIDQLATRLSRFYELPAVGEVRQCGMMVGIELISDRKTKEPYPLEDKVPHQIVLAARKKGLIIRPLGSVMVLMPPLAVSEEELNEMCEIAFGAIQEVTVK